MGSSECHVPVHGPGHRGHRGGAWRRGSPPVPWWRDSARRWYGTPGPTRTAGGDHQRQRYSPPPRMTVQAVLSPAHVSLLDNDFIPGGRDGLIAAHTRSGPGSRSGPPPPGRSPRRASGARSAVDDGEVGVKTSPDGTGHAIEAVDPGAARRVGGAGPRPARGPARAWKEGSPTVAPREGGQAPVHRDMRPPERVRAALQASHCPRTAMPRASYSDRKGVLPAGAGGSPRNGMVSSSICGSWMAHKGWMLAVAERRANREMSPGMHHLEVGQVSPERAGAVRFPGAVRLPGRRQGVQGRYGRRGSAQGRGSEPGTPRDPAR